MVRFGKHTVYQGKGGVEAIRSLLARKSIVMCNGTCEVIHVSRQRRRKLLLGVRVNVDLGFPITQHGVVATNALGATVN